MGSGHERALFLTATTISFYGDWLTVTALVVVLYQSTHSATAPAAYMLLRVVPRPFGGILGGGLADRLSLRSTAIAAVLAQAVLTFGLAAAARGHTLWLVYLLVALSQLAGASLQPVTRAVMSRLAVGPTRERLNQWLSLLNGTGMLVAPAIAAVLLPVVGATPLLLGDAASFIIAAALFAVVRLPAGAGVGVRLPAWPSVLGDSFRMMVSGRRIRTIAAASFGGAASVQAMQAFLVVAAAQRFGSDARVGYFYAAVGLGAVMGAVLNMRGPRGARGLVVPGAVVEVGCIALFAVVPSASADLLLLLVSTAGAVAYQITSGVILQSGPAHQVGRANGAVVAARYLGMVAGTVTALSLSVRVAWPAIVASVSLATLVVLVVAILAPAGPAASAAGETTSASPLAEVPD